MPFSSGSGVSGSGGGGMEGGIRALYTRTANVCFVSVVLKTSGYQLTVRSGVVASIHLPNTASNL